MTVNKATKVAGRQLPPKPKRQRQAKKAADHRWRHKQRLVPGAVLPWNQRSLANRTAHMAAAICGGETTRRKWAAQFRAFWDWYYGETKDAAAGPIRTVVDTFENIEAAFKQRHGTDAGYALRWDCFWFYFMDDYVSKAMWTREPADIERGMWARYHELMEATEAQINDLLGPMWEYEKRKDELRELRDAYRSMGQRK